ncbi:MAG: heparinase II/III family protein [Planctomycetota bacterium]|nr:heparinase II/III family protein [Planctomycetota bacterium]
MISSGSTWSQTLDRAAGDPALRDARERLVAAAKQVAGTPMIRRVYRLVDVGKNRTWLDMRSAKLDDAIRETFALAMSDCSASGIIASEMLLLAAGWRLSKDQSLLDRLLSQLDELLTWSPLQRPGWSLLAPGQRLPACGTDGNWLATGNCVRALVQTAELLPETIFDAGWRARMVTLLEAEIADIVKDWKEKRPWFVRHNNPVTNQWVLPTQGLVQACLFVGVDKHREAYELGVGNLFKSLDSHGSHGEFEEGIAYGSFTVGSMIAAAASMAAAGDRRAIEHPFLARHGTWIVHHYQPARFVINPFDAFGVGRAPRNHAGSRSNLAFLAAYTGSASARWALTNLFDGPSEDLFGLLVSAMPANPEAEVAPPLFANYERATRVNWRSSWADDASGLWVRGGHPTDQHDHHDRGHVNLILRGKAVLIEAGTPCYHHPDFVRHFRTGAGHNTLQLGTGEVTVVDGKPKVPPGWQKGGAVAPISVRSLDAAGGDIRVDGTAGYDGLAHWRRDVKWSADRLAVRDDVALAEGKSEVVLFRWHLATKQPATIEGGVGGAGKSFTVRGSGFPGNPGAAEDGGPVALRIEGSEELQVTQERMPDHTVELHAWDDGNPYRDHTCIVVRSVAAVKAIVVDAVFEAAG